MRLVANVSFEDLDGSPEIAKQADRTTNEALSSLAWISLFDWIAASNTLHTSKYENSVRVVSTCMGFKALALLSLDKSLIACW